MNELAERSRQHRAVVNGGTVAVSAAMSEMARWIQMGYAETTFGYRFADAVFGDIVGSASEPTHTALSLVPDGTDAADLGTLVLWEMASHSFSVSLAGATGIPPESDSQIVEADTFVRGALELLAEHLPDGLQATTSIEEVLNRQTWPARIARTLVEASTAAAPDGLGIQASDVGQVAGFLMLGYHEATARHPYNELLAGQAVAHAVKQLAQPGTPRDLQVTGLVTSAEDVYHALPKTDSNSAALLDDSVSAVLRQQGLTHLARAGSRGRRDANKKTERRFLGRSAR